MTSKTISPRHILTNVCTVCEIVEMYTIIRVFFPEETPEKQETQTYSMQMSL